MSNCCTIPHTGAVPTCPMNGQVTKPVGRKTVESLTRPEVKAALTPARCDLTAFIRIEARRGP